MLLSTRRFLFKYKRLEKDAKKNILTIPEIRQLMYKTLELKSEYMDISKKKPFIRKVEEFLKDEVTMSIVQTLFGDDMGNYISNNMLSYYTNQLSYTISLILKDLGIKSVIHTVEPNSIIILIISYTIAIITIIAEAETH